MPDPLPALLVPSLLDVQLPTPQATRTYGHRLAELLLSAAGQDGCLLLLQGPLGAGKTCLVAGLAEALAIDEPITSPTFALAQHYRGCYGQHAQDLVHLDLYRLDLPAAADDLFWQEEEFVRDQGALMAVEWPERLSRIPQSAWWLQLQLTDTGRMVTLRQPHTHHQEQTGSAPC